MVVLPFMATSKLWVPKMSEMDKYYQMLGLSPGASEEEVKRAYKDLAFVWHPDRFPDSKPHLQERANENFKEVKLAYEKLMDFFGDPKRETFESETAQPDSKDDRSYERSDPPPHEPPPKSEEERTNKADKGRDDSQPRPKTENKQSSTTESGGYKKAKPPPNEAKSQGLNKNISPIIAILVTLGAVIFIIIIGVAYLSPSSKEPQQPIATSEHPPSKEAGPTTQVPGTDTLPPVESQAEYNSTEGTINPPPDPLKHMEKEKPPPSSLPANESSTKTREKKLGAADWLQRGHLLSSSGNCTEAIDAYSRAIDLNPEFSTAYNDRGDAYSYLRNFQQAVRDYDKAIAFDPNFVMPYINRANAYTKLGDYSQAIRDFDKAIDLNPKDALNYNMRGIAYDEIGNHLEAIKDYNKAIDLSPNFAAAYNNRGNAKRHLGYNQQAISDFDTAIEISPGVPVPYFNRGIIYDLIGNNQLAIDDFKTAARLGHKDTQDYLKSKGISW
jgi:Flp pilus assembly protein TadD/curved DNA-binding protein CbpA